MLGGHSKNDCLALAQPLGHPWACVWVVWAPGQGSGTGPRLSARACMGLGVGLGFSPWPGARGPVPRLGRWGPQIVSGVPCPPGQFVGLQGLQHPSIFTVFISFHGIDELLMATLTIYGNSTIVYGLYSTGVSNYLQHPSTIYTFNKLFIAFFNY